MTSKEFQDILGLAQKESARVGHYYIGVEHLFIALTKLKGGVTVSTLEEQGLAPRFIRYMLRQESGQGDNRRFWPGFRETPRCNAVVRMARDLAQRRGVADLSEQDLLLAILREGDSLPCRVLKNAEADLDRLEVVAANWSADQRPQPPTVPVRPREGITLEALEVDLLQQMFRDYAYITVDRQMTEGHTSAKVFVVSPYRADRRPAASVVVKVDERQAILYEKHRYDTYVRDTLPPTTARLLDNPIVPDGSLLAGLKYTFVRSHMEAAAPLDLAMYAKEHGVESLSGLLWESLYQFFGQTWWQQRHNYQFAVWQEYEMVLPSALVTELAPNEPVPRRRLVPTGHWSRRGRFTPGELVALEGFTVNDFYPHRNAVQLTAGAGPEAIHRAIKVEMRGVDKPIKQFFRGGMVDRLVVRVLDTRNDLLRKQVEALAPEFDLDSERLPEHHLFKVQLPNPLIRYANLLQRRLAGSLSTIHGDLHLHNILVGPGGNAWLIDFAQTREGHTLFDWAVLETSLLSEIVVDFLESENWDDIWPVIAALSELGATGQLPSGPLPLYRALEPVAAIRGIVAECLANPDDWSEYFVALALCAMRGLRWNTLSLGARRLLFLVSALAMASATVRDGTSPSSPDIDRTDININF